MCKHSFFKYPNKNSVTVPVPEYKAETLYYGTKVGLGPCLQTVFVTSRAVQCFVLAANLMFQNVGGEMEYLSTQLHIGYSKCEHNTILYRYPGTGSREPSVDSP